MSFLSFSLTCGGEAVFLYCSGRVIARDYLVFFLFREEGNERERMRSLCR